MLVLLVCGSVLCVFDLTGVSSGTAAAENATEAGVGVVLVLAVLLPGCSERTAVLRAQDLLDAVVGRPLRLDDGTLVPLSLSIGVAHGSSATGAEDLCSAAHGALHRARRGGRGR